MKKIRGLWIDAFFGTSCIFQIPNFKLYSKFEDAMDAVITNQKQLLRNNLIDVGRKYLDHLLFLQEYDLAGEVCKKVLGKYLSIIIIFRVLDRGPSQSGGWLLSRLGSFLVQ